METVVNSSHLLASSLVAYLGSSLRAVIFAQGLHLTLKLNTLALLNSVAFSSRSKPSSFYLSYHLSVLLYSAARDGDD